MIDYSFERKISPKELQALFRQTSWAKDRSIEGIQKMLEATPVMLGAWEGDQLVGFVRAITDGIYRGLIDDLIVDESRRKRGIGSELIRRLIEQMVGIDEIFLRCGGNVVSFYRRHGFEKAKCVVMDLQLGKT